MYNDSKIYNGCIKIDKTKKISHLIYVYNIYILLLEQIEHSIIILSRSNKSILMNVMKGATNKDERWIFKCYI